jgi:glycosyltransferase involved in cell wall biosynthesis
MRPALETQIARRGLEDQIRISGWLSNGDVRQHIAAAQVMVLPSFAEGLPVVFMEALALGRPVITTYVAGHPELIEPGRTGWLVPAGSVEALTDAIRQALATPADRLQQMGREGASRVAALHDADQQAARLVELFTGARTEIAVPRKPLLRINPGVPACRQGAV